MASRDDGSESAAPRESEGAPAPLDRDEHGPPPEAVIAIGASAGGLSALKELLAVMPDASGAAVVVVVHLSPDHESHLVDLLRPLSAMPVEQISAITRLERDRVYVVPPGSNVSSVDSHLRLSDLERDRRERAPIDHFFRTLSQTYDGNSVAVVLTGTGSDGALGLRTVKEHGGLTIAQDPNEAEYDGMPQAAIATGMVDLVLRLADIPHAIFSYLKTEPRIGDPDEEAADAVQEEILQRFFSLLRSRTDRDFSRYKRSTLLRRTARRMQIHGVERIEDYLELVSRAPAEAQALADEFLVTVTEFFRDPEVFDELERDVIPKIFAGKGPGDPVRVWSVGCATGEEAYSIAMLLLEHASTLEEPPPIQVFASDLHDASLRRAREGVYPETIESRVPAPRLRRFFVREHGAYRIRQEVREAIVFTPHNVLSDAPFSRLDLLSCRNLLIYLDRGVQREVIELFHYALRPSGYLLLGPSESLEHDEQFAIENKAHSLFRKLGNETHDRKMPTFPLAHRTPSVPPEPPRTRHLRGFAEAHSDLLDQVGPPSILIGADEMVLHLSKRAGRYLHHPGGGLTGDVARLVIEPLRLEVRTALNASKSSGAPARGAPVRVEGDGEERVVTVEVRPGVDPRYEGVRLLLFEERTPSAMETDLLPRRDSDAWSEDDRVGLLERELTAIRRRLQEVVKEGDSSAEEMRANNEELRWTNEEFRSSMEELETSKEELQSVNEELITVNEENRHKVAELAQMSSDLQTLMGATDIATLFLDRDLRILRFTPRLGSLFSIRLSDRGRPVGDLTHRFGAHDLVKDARRVLELLVPIERELVTSADEVFLTRIHPYHSIDDRVEGIVITFVDISSHKEAERRVREVNARLEHLVAERTLQLRHANEELEAFNHSVSHDLRAPLRGIERFSRVVLDGHAEGLDDTGRDLLGQVLAGARRMSDLIDGLLALSKISRAELRWEEVDLSAIANDLARELHMREHDRRVEITVDPNLSARGDRRLVRIVMANLLENAWKFTRNGAARIEVGGRAADAMAEFFVRDNGAGFDMRAARRLFVPFQRLHLAEEFEGTGIGLALVHRIVTRHGGTVTATGAMGAGATITFTLPTRALESKSSD